MELNNRKRLIKEYLQLLVNEDGDFYKTLHDQLTKEKKHINNTLKLINQKIVKYKDVIEREFDLHNLELAEDMRDEVIDAETEFFDRLKSHRKLQAEHDAIKKRIDAEHKEKILSELHSAKRALVVFLGPDEDIVHKKPKLGDDRE